MRSKEERKRNETSERRTRKAWTILAKNHVHEQQRIVHADLMTKQCPWRNDGFFKLGDFNRCQFLYQNMTANRESCPYLYSDDNLWIFRSPEEYLHTQKSMAIDV